MQVQRWRSAWMLKNTLIQPTTSKANTHCASIHSTPIVCEKWKNKWDSTNDTEKSQEPSKTYARYVTRQKRADTKKALKDLLFNSGSAKISLKDDERLWKVDEEHSYGAGRAGKKRQSKSSARRATKSMQPKRKTKKERFFDDFSDTEKVFHATFGNRWYTWSFNESSCRGSKFAFQWREKSEWKSQGSKEWDATSDAEDDYSCSVGSSSDRSLLGLPPTGPLKIEDVKNAFRLSALKWHPDKHQGGSQAIAEERFKLCVNAYKSLCSALSGV